MRGDLPWAWAVVGLALLLVVPITHALPRAGTSPASPGREALAPTDGAAELAAARASLATSAPPALRPGPSAPSTTPAWHLATPAVNGSPLMVYDNADKYVLLLGGLLANQSDPTWTYSGGHWAEQAVAVSPPARIGGAMVYDAADREVVLFGGQDALSPNFLNDTWTYSAGSWTQLNPGTAHAPSARSYPAMAYDSADRYVVLFGGANLQCAYLSCYGSDALQETWNFSKGVWNQINSSTYVQPPGRSAAELTSDGSNGVLLTGGDSLVSCPCFNDTWNFSAGNWSNLTASAGPVPSLSYGSGAYEVGSSAVVLLGGLFWNFTASNETWTFGTSWSLVSTAAAPAPADTQFPIAYDPALAAVILFGVPLYSFSHGGPWTVLGPHPLPPPTGPPFLAWDAKDHLALLFDGTTGSTWTYQKGHWAHLAIKPSLAPPLRFGGEMVYDAADGYVVLFGGRVFTCSGTLCNYWDDNDTWTFTGGAWTNITSSPAPSPRLHAGMAYDGADGYVVLFGGSQCFPGYFASSCRDDNDTWKFLGGIWSPLSPIGGKAPSGRHLSSMSYNAAGHFVVLFGGVHCSFTVANCATLNDTWTYRGGAWIVQHPKVVPTSRAGASITYDPRARGLVIFGGGTVDVYGSWTGFLAETWVRNSSGWVELSFGAAFTPSPRWGAGFVYLPNLGRDLLVDGGFPPEDIWTLSGA